jgi:hypothetical protein
MYWGVQTGTWLAGDVKCIELQELDAWKLSVVCGSKHRSFAWTFSNQTNFIIDVFSVKQELKHAVVLTSASSFSGSFVYLRIQASII